jgi:hypothetical protein
MPVHGPAIDAACARHGARVPSGSIPSANQRYQESGERAADLINEIAESFALKDRHEDFTAGQMPLAAGGLEMSSIG